MSYEVPSKYRTVDAQLLADKGFSTETAITNQENISKATAQANAGAKLNGTSMGTLPGINLNPMNR